MSEKSQHLDDLFAGWPYEFGEVAARKVRGSDDRELLQLRIDMGVLQLETTGRPDGALFDGYATYLDYLQAMVQREGADFQLDETRCVQIDREFVQFYHRRIAWLALSEFERAVADSDHTLALMDLSSLYAPHAEWAAMHEQYRPFVLFHRTQAAALAAVQNLEPQTALVEIEDGMTLIEEAYQSQGTDPHELEEDEFLTRLAEMKEALAQQYEIEPPLSKQLADAVAREQYELAAELRDKIAQRSEARS
jgi:hypothetical protein